MPIVTAVDKCQRVIGFQYSSSPFKIKTYGNLVNIKILARDISNNKAIHLIHSV